MYTLRINGVVVTRYTLERCPGCGKPIHTLTKNDRPGWRCSLPWGVPHGRHRVYAVYACSNKGCHVGFCESCFKKYASRSL